jgi:cyclophilin family peptidyl-prolyl cis-trans isomerase
MVDANAVLRQMEGAGTRLNLMILDACRNNPFGGRGLRSTSPGLAQMQAPEGTLISYATQPGNVALDGNDGNSPFTKALAQAVRKPGAGVFEVFNDVGLQVKRMTGGSQQPWVSSSPIDGQFYFAGLPPGGGGAPIAGTASPPAAVDAEIVFWQSIASSSNPADYQAYLSQYPNGRFAPLARARAQAQQQAAIPPTTPKAPLAQPRAGENTLYLDLQYGRVVIALRPDLAPRHVARIKELAREGFYDGLSFHRVIDGFMAQAGDPTGTGYGGSGLKLAAEFGHERFVRGTVAMARASDPDSADSQFFIMFAPASFLDGKYTVIGRVTSGMEFVDRIKRGQPPDQPDRIIRMQVAADVR